jgi:hypothetical protein
MPNGDWSHHLALQFFEDRCNTTVYHCPAQMIPGLTVSHILSGSILQVQVYCTLSTIGSPDVTCDKVLGQIIVSSGVPSVVTCDIPGSLLHISSCTRTHEVFWEEQHGT